MVSEHDKKRLTEEQQGRLSAIDASVRRGAMSMDEGHKQAEAVRSAAGYSGGADGSDYIPLNANAGKNANGGFDASALISALAGKNNKWQQSLEDAAKNYTGMSYGDFVQSDDYASLAKRYNAQGQKAMQATLGEVAARTGGLASSYAVSAAQQQYNDFMSRLEEAAMSMYDVKRDDAAANVSMLQSMYDNEESRNKYVADLAYQLGRDKVSDARYENELAYSKEQDALDRADAKEADSFEKKLLEAETLAQIGDFSGYKALYGWSDEQIASMQQAYLEEKAAANYKEPEEYEPTISLKEAMELYNDGVTSSNVISALRYYLGDDYFGEEDASTSSGLNATPYQTAYNAAQKTLNSANTVVGLAQAQVKAYKDLLAAYNNEQITEDELIDIIEKLGINIPEA